jgi:pyruvate carboxylase
MRTVFFELNGQPREVVIQDKALVGKAVTKIKANAANPLELGAPMPGMISRVLVCQRDKVISGQKLFTLEAMKMETTVCAALAGTVAEVALGAGAQVETGDLVVKLK